MKDDLPVMSFEDGSSLRAWLAANHRESQGLWVRIFKPRAGIRSVTFEDLLEQGLCFGWSESKRMRGDETFYLQRFTPRRRPGTTSDRNMKIVQRLLAEGKMTESGSRRWRWPHRIAVDPAGYPWASDYPSGGASWYGAVELGTSGRRVHRSIRQPSAPSDTGRCRDVANDRQARRTTSTR